MEKTDRDAAGKSRRTRDLEALADPVWAAVVEEGSPALSLVDEARREIGSPSPGVPVVMDNTDLVRRLCKRQAARADRALNGKVLCYIIPNPLRDVGERLADQVDRHIPDTVVLAAAFDVEVVDAHVRDVIDDEEAGRFASRPERERRVRVAIPDVELPGYHWRESDWRRVDGMEFRR